MRVFVAVTDGLKEPDRTKKFGTAEFGRIVAGACQLKGERGMAFVVGLDFEQSNDAAIVLFLVEVGDDLEHFDHVGREILGAFGRLPIPEAADGRIELEVVLA